MTDPQRFDAAVRSFWSVREVERAWAEAETSTDRIVVTPKRRGVH